MLIKLINGIGFTATPFKNYGDFMDILVYNNVWNSSFLLQKLLIELNISSFLSGQLCHFIFRDLCKKTKPAIIITTFIRKQFIYFSDRSLLSCIHNPWYSFYQFPLYLLPLYDGGPHEVSSLALLIFFFVIGISLHNHLRGLSLL